MMKWLANEKQVAKNIAFGQLPKWDSGVYGKLRYLAIDPFSLFNRGV